MASSAPQKSTTVRLSQLKTRAYFRTAELVAPRRAGRVARDLWFSVPPRIASADIPCGGESFEVTSLGATVRGTFWGEGPVVYLVHGWGGRGSQLSAFVDPLVDQGFRVVMFDGPAHGESDHGPAGPGRTHGVEFGKALDAVFLRFGPAHAVVAHSLGTIATYLALRFGWLSTERMILLAPMVEAASLFDEFQKALGFGRRTRAAFDREVDAFVGIDVAEFDARRQARHVEPVPTLVFHDNQDRQTWIGDAMDLVDNLRNAKLIATDGLGHRRILSDPEVVDRAVRFLGKGRPARALPRLTA